MQRYGGAYGTPVGAEDASEAQDLASVLSSSLPYFMGAARKITNSSEPMIHEDMVQGAITKLIELERSSPGSITNVRQYVVTVMRNAAIDAARSPQSKVIAADMETLVMPDEEHSYRDVDNATERGIVRRALGRLTPDHRTVLLGYVDGLRPRQLAPDLRRDPAAVSALYSRAKHALRRATLVEVLAYGGRDCRANAERLPPRVQLDLMHHSERDSGLRHIRRCRKCQKNWRRFALLSSAFGVLPLATVDQAFFSAPAAAAAGGLSIAGRARARPSPLAITGFTFFTVGFVTFVWTLPPVQEALFKQRYDFTVNISRTEGGSGAPAMAVNLRAVDGSPWQYTKLVVRTPEATGQFAPLEGWKCDQSAYEMTCTPKESSSAAAPELCITGIDETLREADFRLELSIDAGIAWYEAYAWGKL